jgi:hypothetical protein
VDIPFASPDGTLIVPVPEGLAPGDYDIRVLLADGREAVREQGFSIVAAPTDAGGSDGGLPADGGPPEGSGLLDGIVGLQFDPIGDQVRDVPFPSTLRAVGPSAETFQVPVTIRASKGSLSSRAPSSFVRGVRVEQLSLSHPGPNVYLLAEDALGHRALSNSFRVRAH